MRDVRLFALVLSLFVAVSCSEDAGGGAAATTGIVTGQVVSETGTPLDGVVVSVEGTAHSAVTGTGGRYLIDGVEPGLYAVFAERSSFEGARSPELTVVAGGVTDVPDIMLRRLLGTISGSVRREGSKDASGITVALLGAERELTTGEDGTFSFADVPAGTYSLRASAEGHEDASVAPFPFDGATSPPLGTLVLRPVRGGLEGVATLEGRDEHDGILVTVRDTSYATVSGLDGGWRIDGLPAGQYTVVARYPDFGQASTADLTVQLGVMTAAPRLVLASDPGTVTGTVTLEDGGSPQGVIVRLDGTDIEALCDDAGGFSLSAVPPGDYTVTALRDGYEPRQSPWFGVAPGAAAELAPLALRRARGTVRGRVLLGDGSDHSGVRVELLSGGGSTYSGADGVWEIADVVATTYTVAYTHDGYGSETLEGVVVPADTVAEVPDVVLVAVPGSLSGTVSREDGGSPATVTITLVGSEHTAQPDESGGYALTGVREGNYTLRMAVGGPEAAVFVPTERAVVVRAGEDTAVPATRLSVARGHVAGTVRLEGRGSHAGARVEVEGGAFSALTGAGGDFVLSDLPVGVVDLRVSAEGFRPLRVAGVDVLRDRTTSLEPVELTVPRGTLSGRFLLEGSADHAGVEVVLVGTELVTNTAADGSWSLAGVPAGTWRLEARRDGYRPYPVFGLVVLADTVNELGELWMAPYQGQITGTVRLEGRVSHGGAVVRLEGTVSATVTDGDGSFTLEVPPGSYPGGLVAELEDFASARFDGTMVVIEDGVFSVGELALRATHNGITGTVRLEGRGEHGGVEVVATGATGGAAEGVTASAVTAADGYFRLPSLPLGPYRVAFRYSLEEGWEQPAYAGVDVRAGDATALPEVLLRRMYVLIDDGAEAATSADVTLTLGASSCLEMQVADSEDFAGAEWQPCAAELSWTLPGEDGLKTVWARFRTAGAPTQATSPVSDSVLLDREAIIVAFEHDAVGVLTARDRLHLTLDAERGSRATVAIAGYEAGIPLFDDGNHHDGAPGDGLFATLYPIRRTDDVTDATVTAYVVDPWGNEGSLDADTPVTIVVPPQILDLTVTTDDEAGTATVTWATDEPSTGRVHWGADTSYAFVSESAALSMEHAVTLGAGVLEPGVSYHLAVEATDANGHATQTLDRTFQLVPDRPTRVVAVPGLNRAWVRWEAPAQRNVVGYALFRGPSADAVEQRLTPAPYDHEALMFRDDDVAAGEEVCYAVAAVDTSGNLGVRSEVSCATPGDTAAASEVRGVVTGVAVWSELGSPYTMTAGVAVDEGALLVIGPNVEVRVASYVALIAHGTLVTLGERGEALTGEAGEAGEAGEEAESDDGLVVIHSASETPTNGDWKGIRIEPSSPPGRLDLNDGRYFAGNLLYRTRVAHAEESAIDHCTNQVWYGEDGAGPGEQTLALVRCELVDNGTGTVDDDVSGRQDCGSAPAGEQGGAGLCFSGRKLLVRGSAFRRCTHCAPPGRGWTMDGGGAWVQAETAYVGESVFEDNRSSQHGGGLVIGAGKLDWPLVPEERGVARFVVTGCTFRRNRTVFAQDGGGLYAARNCSGGDCQLCLPEMHGVIHDCRFEGNIAGEGGGVQVVDTGCAVDRGTTDVRVVGCSFVQNGLSWAASDNRCSGAVGTNHQLAFHRVPLKAVVSSYFEDNRHYTTMRHGTDVCQVPSLVGNIFHRTEARGGRDAVSVSGYPDLGTALYQFNRVETSGDADGVIFGDVEPNYDWLGQILLGGSIVYRGNSFDTERAPATQGLGVRVPYTEPDIDARGNYWGPAATAALDAGPHPQNVSSIYDYYDNVERAAVIYDEWAQTAFPMPRVTGPRWGYQFRAGVPVVLTGAGDDPEDGPLAGNSLEWRTADGDVLGYGESLTLTGLPVGEHWIYLHAFDSAGQEAHVPTVVEVVP